LLEFFLPTITHRAATPAGAWSTIHPVSSADQAVMAQVRATVAPNKGMLRGTAARVPFDGIVGSTAAPEGVSFRQDRVGGVAGFWCEPAGARHGAAILHLHGGWFNFGSAQAYRHLVGHIARGAGAAAFIPDYRLAPEHPFPAALDDVLASYRGLVERGLRNLTVTGDSAGGNLALVLLGRIAASGGMNPAGAVALSPVTDLTMSGKSWDDRAEADPYFVRAQGEELIRAYLQGQEAADAQASPLFGSYVSLPPVRVLVGNDEVLLDDSWRYVERAVAAGVDARLDVWEGMPHGFIGSVGQLQAADQAMKAIGVFLSTQLAAADLAPVS
jgi:acetyl esterase/lipase